MVSLKILVVWVAISVIFALFFGRMFRIFREKEMRTYAKKYGLDRYR